jgi:hypothetical protein
LSGQAGAGLKGRLFESSNRQWCDQGVQEGQTCSSPSDSVDVNLPHEPLTKKIEISVKRSCGNEIVGGVQYLSWPALSIWNVDETETPYEPSLFIPNVYETQRIAQ